MDIEMGGERSLRERRSGPELEKVTNYSFIFSRLNDTKEGEEVYGI